MTEGACISISCERNMWPLCSSMRATPLKIITTARRSVHTLMGSKEAFNTRTRAFMVEAILREPQGKCQKSVSEQGSHASDRTHRIARILRAVRRHPCRLFFVRECEQDAREPPTG